MFIDEVEIYVKSGNGGNGAVSFRREKYVPKGGPDGGDGGNGGDVIVRGKENIHGLTFFNMKKKFLAENGQNGMGKNKKGKDGEDLCLYLPLGTQIYSKEELIADIISDKEEFVLAKGGRGGWGNQHFATSIKQAPTWSKDGEKGKGLKIKLELKTIADIGLVGLPNAGKSTLISVLTKARPKIADYPFTTLEPNLGTYTDSDSRFVIADIPGLIEGASKGRGLGYRFLRHIERTKLLVHLISAESTDLVKDYNTIQGELKSFSNKLLSKKEVVVISKADIITEKDLEKEIARLSRAIDKPVLAISAATSYNIDHFIKLIKKSLN